MPTDLPERNPGFNWGCLIAIVINATVFGGVALIAVLLWR